MTNQELKEILDDTKKISQNYLQKKPEYLDEKEKAIFLHGVNRGIGLGLQQAVVIIQQFLDIDERDKFLKQM